MKKITKATFKSFLKKNSANLFIKIQADFNGMTDCVEYLPVDERKFVLLQKCIINEIDYQYGAERGCTREQVEDNFFNNKNTLGYRGIWLVDNNGDSFRDFEDDKFKGIEVYNCCGSFTIAIQKSI